MSRTGFAERFRTVSGGTPLSYLTHWRWSSLSAHSATPKSA
ncbi:hypothetical protein [Curtobacterium sp. MCBD17_032]|nr:hypothetical protein [Curtobacterium sp. MCBD17_032]